jgi:hypothetical protein
MAATVAIKAPGALSLAFRNIRKKINVPIPTITVGTCVLLIFPANSTIGLIRPVDSIVGKDGVYGHASRIFSWLQKGARFIGVFASLSKQGGTPAQRAAKTSGFETPAEI